MAKEYWMCVIGPFDRNVFGKGGEAQLRRPVEIVLEHHGLSGVDVLSGMGLDERGAKEAGDAHGRSIARAMGEDTGIDPRDFIDAIRELFDDHIRARRDAGDPIVDLPDLREAIDRVEKEGIGPCDRPRGYEPIDWSNVARMRSRFGR